MPFAAMTLAVLACSSDPVTTTGDAATDVARDAEKPDAAADVAADIVVDTPVDAPTQPDAPTDAPTQPDASVDVPRDAVVAPDVAVDVAPDVAMDVARDTSVTPDVTADVAPDVAMDVPRDTVVTMDVAPDAPRDVAAPDAPADVVTPPTGTSILTYLTDFQRSGANRTETRLTPAALRAGRLMRDTTFATSLTGSLYAQPLYVPGVTIGGASHDVLYVATEGNFVYALDAVTGATLWRTAVGSTVSSSLQGCGNIGTIGVTGTPVIDAATRTLYAVSFTNDGALRFRVNALDLTTGTQRAGYPAAITPPASNGSTFDERVTGQRGALALRGSTLYVPFGGLYGDCGIYHGWVVGIDTTNPMRQASFATPGRGSGAWAPAGPSLDGAGHLFVATGNSTPLGSSTPGSLGEFVLRFNVSSSTPAHTIGTTADEFSPSDARSLDLQDLDIGSVSPVVLPTLAGGAVRLVQGGKAGVVYLLDAANLGGATPVFTTRVSSGGIFGAMAAYSNGTDTFAFIPTRGTRASCGGSNGVMAMRATATTLTTAWCTAAVAAPNPPVVSSNGNSDAVLWVLGASTGVGSTPVLRAYEVATGMEVYGNTEAPPSVRQWVPPVVADGRVYVTGATSIAMYRLR